MGRPSRVRVAGPLAPYAAGFRRALARQGYALNAASNQLQLMAHASRWLENAGLDAAQRRGAEYCGRRSDSRVHEMTGRQLRWVAMGVLVVSSALNYLDRIPVICDAASPAVVKQVIRLCTVPFLQLKQQSVHRWSFLSPTPH